MSGLLPRRARVVLGRRAGLVWAVPLAAFLVVAYLGLRALANPGIEATIVFHDAAGAMPGDTKVIYRGLQVGHVSRIVLDRDGHSVDVTVRLDRRVKPALTTSAAFWLEGANVDFADLASLRAAVAGVTIDMAAGGPGAAPTLRFRGLDARPMVMPDEKGTWYWLQTDNIGAIRAGSNVLYRGIEVGKITRVDLAPGPALRARAFVRAPYDALVRPGSLFWTVAPLRISFSGADIGAQFDPSAALGAVTFETPEPFRDQAASAPDSVFALYLDQTHALGDGVGPKVLYRARFTASAGSLAKGAPVTLGGIQVGEVTEVGMSLDPETGKLDMPVTFAIEPLRVHLKGVPADRLGDRAVMDRAMAGLLARGYRAELEQNPPLVGASYIALDATGLGPARLDREGPYPLVPSRAMPDLTELGDKTTLLLDHLDAVPLQEIGENTRQITARLARLLNSGKIDESVARLDDTLGETDKLVQAVRPQVGPLAADLRHAADQLDQLATSANQMVSGQGASPDANLPDALREVSNAARSLRALADELQRHPEVLIQGKHP